MSQLDPLIADLALILICAGIMTLLFKSLKQPIVLGYIVAGFLASPNMSYMPSVTDMHGIHTWSEIGVIFLLFALGLEFSFKKILKMGAAPIIAAVSIILCMMYVGTCTGSLFGWSNMDCIYLGGMLAMSSTTIIFKAFDDMGLRNERFAGLVLSVLIIEDILAIVLMVMLSTLAISKEFEGTQMLLSITQLGLYLVLWFTVGLFFIPIVLRKLKPLMNEETLLIIALALCFGMVVAASAAGFSAAFGAFVMGSILAETVEAEKIEHLVNPVKNLFGAIFFVSVGMMVDLNLIIEYIVPILCIIAAIMLGQTVLSTCGFLLSGQSLKTSMQCSFSLTQIGEFAFILATLGTSLHVTSDFLYPIVVAVSVFTTFTTPYMIRLANPAYNVVARILPAKLIEKLERYENEKEEKAPDELKLIWNRCFKRYVLTILINSVLCIAIMSVMLYYGQPLIAEIVPEQWVHSLTAFIALILCTPFLWQMLRSGADSPEVNKLWESGVRWRIRISAYGVLRIIITAVFVSYFVDYAIPGSTWLGMFALVAIMILIFYSSVLKTQSNKMVQKFTDNLTAREKMKEL
ncbi:MAG: cation:proton antiporter [Bacteroidaceae bacterium]|nr:cation:proton antiporter [Bacteroidaceae bacterium]